ncbi:MAG: thermonuclease family protein [Hyphomicrobiaceae bacterium]|nr:thermonuclease family protein [Hyphomicrobiaceae bacterium]
MFTSRDKSDGFEWHKYIRTTIKVRRDARRQRVIDARRAAGHQIKAAGAALLAGSRAAGGAIDEGARAGVGALGLVLQAGWALFLHLTRAIVHLIAVWVARPLIGVPLGLFGAIFVGVSIGRWRSLGPDREAVMTLVIGVVLMASLVPVVGRVVAWRPPMLPPRMTPMLAGLALLVAGAAWLSNEGGLGRLAVVGKLPLIGGRSLHGYAYADGANTLRIGGTTLRLTGIDTPEVEQRCGRPGWSWRCGRAAEMALSKLVKGRRVSCALSGSDDAGHAFGRCSVGQMDVGAELVRQGHVFAEGGILARYAAEEREARAAKAGMWGGDVERPAEYRAKLWEGAKRRAPKGCPIKGQMTESARIYVLPWSPDYERVRVHRTRGERWFCSEAEALAAGFRAARRG